ncbi:MAG: exopolysaccharide biosynthesis protein [Phyllobacteriaceae bacterium]|nr:exopolysaccharide biosynthesis protein [Phyllobacteriaceae bacterium]
MTQRPMFEQTHITGAAVDTPDLPPYRPRPLSVVLRELAAREQGDVTVRCIRNALADRSFATFLVFTCVINMLPFPPGSTVVLGVPIVLVALQMVAGRDTVWLPEFFLRRSMSHESFGRMTRRVIPLLEKLETWIRPRRWPFASHRAAERIVGVYALVLGIAVILPVPFGNWLPAFACAICGLALSERDGGWLWIGIITGAISILVIFTVVFTAGAFALHWLGA